LESQAQSTRNIGSISTSRWPPTFPNRVCFIILIPENGKMDEGARHAVVPKNSAFDFIRNPAADPCAVNDGKPFK
jgi:hypothetical protein